MTTFTYSIIDKERTIFMKRTIKQLIVVSCLILMIVVSGTNVKAEYVEKFGSPVVLINAGDSGAIYITKAICEKAGMQFDVGIDVIPEQLKKGSGRIGENKERYMSLVEYNSNFPLGTPYEALVVTIATQNSSGVGGLSLKYIIEQVEFNLYWAKENEIPIIGVYASTRDDRGNTKSTTEFLIDLVAPYCDILITTVSSNYDGRFTKLGKNLGIPVIESKNLTALVGVFQELFGIEPTE